MDAYWDETCYQFLKRLNLSQTTIINTWKPPTRTYLVVKSEATIINSIAEDLAAGKRVVVASMSSEFCERLRETVLQRGILRPEDIMMHTGKSGDALRDMLQDVDKLWAKVLLLMYTPAIESGAPKFMHAAPANSNYIGLLLQFAGAWVTSSAAPANSNYIGLLLQFAGAWVTSSAAPANSNYIGLLLQFAGAWVTSSAAPANSNYIGLLLQFAGAWVTSSAAPANSNYIGLLLQFAGAWVTSSAAPANSKYIGNSLQFARCGCRCGFLQRHL